MTEILRTHEMEMCKACDGFGNVPYVDKGSLESALLISDDIPFIIVTCPICHGEGEVPS